jgi:polyamine oxidase
MLNSIITKIEYNKEGVTVYTKAGDVVHADYAISTFS